ncbi:MAG: DUF4214 domain-containing protein [Paracoccaceae bacterium]
MVDSVALARALNTVLGRPATDTELEEAAEAESLEAAIQAVAAEAQIARMIVTHYRVFYGREPDPEGFAYWTKVAHAHAEDGVVPAKTDVQIASAFAEGAEYELRYAGLDTREIVERMYRDNLAREGDEDGVDYWTSRLDAGMTVAELGYAFATSTEIGDTLADEVTEVLVGLGLHAANKAAPSAEPALHDPRPDVPWADPDWTPDYDWQGGPEDEGKGDRDDAPEAFHGGAGDDRLFGEGGDDIVAGGSGDDRVDGGPGSDILTGGEGADKFVFNNDADNPSRAELLEFYKERGYNWDNITSDDFKFEPDSTVDAPDIVTDFEPGKDKIVFKEDQHDTDYWPRPDTDDIDVMGGALPAKGAAVDHAGEIALYDWEHPNGTGTTLHFDADGDGIVSDGDFVIHLDGVAPGDLGPEDIGFEIG